MISLRNSSDYGAKAPRVYQYNENLMKYITISAYNKENNRKTGKNRIVKTQKIEVTDCAEELARNFTSWKDKHKPICFGKSNTNMLMEQQLNSFQAAGIVVERCTPENKSKEIKKCASESEIDEFVKYLYVGFYAK